MKEGRDICFTDDQGNEFFVMVREGSVKVWKNKTQIDDVRFYDDELTEEQDNQITFRIFQYKASKY